MVSEVCSLEDLQGSEYVVVQSEKDIHAIAADNGLLDFHEISGMVVKPVEGALEEIWGAESARPFELNTAYTRLL